MAKRRKVKKLNKIINAMSIQKAIDCVKREVKRRCVTYPKLIVEGKAPEMELKKELSDMQQVQVVLEKLLEGYLPIKPQMNLFDVAEYEIQEKQNFY